MDFFSPYGYREFTGRPTLGRWPNRRVRKPEGQLTLPELLILRRMRDGMKRRHIAEELDMKPDQVSAVLSAARVRFGVGTIAELRALPNVIAQLDEETE